MVTGAIIGAVGDSRKRGERSARSGGAAEANGALGEARQYSCIANGKPDWQSFVG